MTVLEAAFWVSCLVLVAAGSTKLVEPVALARAVGALGVRGPAASVGAARVLGVCEVAVGLLGLVVGGRLVAVAAAALYVVFSVVVLLARRSGLGSCGCFGERSGAPSLLHASLNLASALMCAAAVARPVGPVADVLGDAAAGTWLGLVAVLSVSGLIVAIEAR